MLEERRRIARDVHDTLEQELVGLGLQLDAAAAAVARGREAPPLDATRRIVRRIHDEVRVLVWDLRDADPVGPADALAALAGRFADGPPVTVTVTGEAWPVPAIATHHLSRIAQEAVTNALKHAAPGAVRVGLAFSPADLRLTVSDDGRGFEPSAPRPGHFGLMGMRERARKLGADVRLTTGPGRGTVVEVVVARSALGGLDS